MGTGSVATRAYGAMGASGSCTCTTSKPPRRMKRSARSIGAGQSTTGATEPFECTSLGRPIT